MEKNWKDFVSLYGGIEGARANFEKVCYSLFKKQYHPNNVQLIEAAPGDEGIDIYVGNRETESIKVFQCKFFIEKIGDSQKNQIRNSFKTIIESNEQNVDEWLLCIPKESLNTNEDKWWSGWKHRNSKKYNIRIELLLGSDLINLLKEFNLYNQVFKVTDSIRIEEIHSIIKNVEDYINIAESKIRIDPNIALEFFNKAQLKAKSINNSELEIRSILGNAECNIFLKEHNKAIHYAKKSIEICRDVNNSYYLSLSYMILAQAFEAKNMLNEGYDEMCNAQISAIECGNEYNLARISLVKARFSLKTNRKDEAKDLVAKFSSLIKEKGGLEKVLVIELEGKLDFADNKFKKGLLKIKSAISLAKEYNLYNTAYDLTISLGRDLFNQKKFLDSKSVFEDSYEISEFLGIQQKCTSKLFIAETLYALDNEEKFNDSLQLLEELIPTSKINQLSFVLGEAYVLKSIILMHKKDYGQVFRNIQESFNYFNEINDLNSNLRNLFLLGDLAYFSNQVDYSNEFINKYRYYINNAKLNKKTLEELNSRALQIFDNLGEYDQAFIALDRIKELNPKPNKEISQRINITTDYLNSKIHLSNTFNELINCENPLLLAGTDGAKTLSEANSWVLGPLLDWIEGTKPFHGVGIETTGLGLMYDFFGQISFSRLILNLKAFPNIFHLSIEVSSVEEARKACKSFLPLTDCLTLVWKGRFEIGSGFIPGHLNNCLPVKNWEPYVIDKENARMYFMMATPIVCCTLPLEILNFYFNEVVTFVKAGKLLLAPGPMVGCMNINHSILEEAYCKTTNGYSIQNDNTKIEGELALPFIFPYFPDIDFDTMSKIINDEQESLRNLRLTLLEWSLDIEKNGFNPLKKLYFSQKFDEMINPINKEFEKISKKKYNSTNNNLIKYEMTGIMEENNANYLKVNTNSADSSSILWSIFNNNFKDKPGFACFRLMGLGKKWELNGPSISFYKNEEIINLRPEMLNWLKMPGEHKTYVLGVKKENTDSSPE